MEHFLSCPVFRSPRHQDSRAHYQLTRINLHSVESDSTIGCHITKKKIVFYAGFELLVQILVHVSSLLSTHNMPYTTTTFYLAESVEQDQPAHTCSLILLCTLRSYAINNAIDNAISQLEISLFNAHQFKSNNILCKLVGLLVVLKFNATLTATVMSWRSVTHMCLLAFSHQY